MKDDFTSVNKDELIGPNTKKKSVLLHIGIKLVISA